jgi:hypothetical protein
MIVAPGNRLSLLTNYERVQRLERMDITWLLLDLEMDERNLLSLMIGICLDLWLFFIIPLSRNLFH